MTEYKVTIVSRNHTDTVLVQAASPSEAIDYILETRSYDIRTLLCEDLEVNL